MTTSGLTNGYQSLLNLSTFDSLDDINSSTVTVNNSLTLPYISPYAILETDINSNVIGQNLTNGQLLIGSTSVAPVAATLSATAHQTTITNGSGTISIGCVQNIDTTSSPTFVNVNSNLTGTVLTPSQPDITSLGILSSLSVTGNITNSALTASQAVVSDGSKNLASLAYTTARTASTLVERDGSNNINADLTGTILTAAQTNITSLGTLSSLSVTGNITNAALTASQAVVSDGSKNLASLAYTTSRTASTLVERDSSNNINADLTGSISGGTVSGLTVTATASSGQIILGTTNTLTLTAPSIPSSSTLTFPVGLNDNIVSTTSTDILQNKSLTTTLCKFVDTTDHTKVLKFSISAFLTNTTRTWSFPTLLNDQVTGIASSQDLTNKGLDDASCTFYNDADPTKILAFTLANITTGNTRTLTIPDATGQIVLLNTSDVLTNKQLDCVNCTFIGHADSTKVLQVDTSTNTTGKTLTLSCNQTNNNTLTFPNATDTLVSLTVAGTLTNKALSDSTTSIVGFADATKKVLFSNGFATTGKQLTLSFAGTNSRILTWPDNASNSTIVDLITAQTMTNKTLTTPIIASISNSGTVTIPTGTDTLVNLTSTQTLTNKTLTTPVISSITNTGTITLPTSTDTLVGRATTDTLTNKTLTTPVISSITNTGTITLPTSTDTLVGRATTDTLTNKTLTSPTINTATMSGGTLDNCVIGGSTAVAGSFTTISATSNFTCTNIKPQTTATYALGDSSHTFSDLYLNTSGGTPTSLNYYESASFTVVFSGPFPNQNVTVNIIRVGAIASLNFPNTTANGNSTNVAISATVPAARFYPLNNTYTSILVANNNATVLGTLGITTAGAISINVSPLSNFTSSATTTGFYGCTMNYSV